MCHNTTGKKETKNKKLQRKYEPFKVYNRQAGNVWGEVLCSLGFFLSILLLDVFFLED